MRQFILTSSLLSAVAALAMVAICVVMPKLEWILASIALAAFATVQYFNFRKSNSSQSKNSALPQNLWVKGSNISRMEAFGFFAFPR
jgi:Flp pilus assembly protein TadB